MCADVEKKGDATKSIKEMKEEKEEQERERGPSWCRVERECLEE